MEPRELSIKDRIANKMFAFDCFLFSFCTLGLSYPHESFSSAAWRAEKNGLFYGRFRPKTAGIGDQPQLSDMVGGLVSEAARAEEIKEGLLSCYRQYDKARDTLNTPPEK